jgi:intraflagellar transport protein 80
LYGTSGKSGHNHHWSAPQIIDTKGIVNVLLQAPQYFLTVDSFAGIRVYTYDGRQVSNPVIPGLQAEFLTRHMVSVSNDTIALIDTGNARQIRLLDIQTGKEIAGGPLGLPYDAREVTLSKYGPAHARLVAVRDANDDVFLSRVNRRNLVKIGSMCSSVQFHEEHEMLVSVVDQKLNVWWRPSALFIDKAIHKLAVFARDDKALVKGSSILAFTGTRCFLRRPDGVNLTIGVPPVACTIYKLVAKAQWSGATRLARFARNESMWALLASLAVEYRELTVAEASYGALGLLDRVEFVQRLKLIPSEEGRAAELAVLARELDRGEQILLQAGLVYRAIDLAISLFRWERALDLAMRSKAHVDTVLHRRQLYLQAAGLEESSPKFIQLQKSIPIDPVAIEAKIKEELEKEAQRPGARPAIMTS